MAQVKDMAREEAYLADFARLEAADPGSAGVPVWWQRTRKEAIGRFAEMGFPTTRQEEWRFTNVGPLSRMEFRLAKPGEVPVKRQDLAWAGLDGLSKIRLVFVNGYYAPHLSSAAGLPEGVQAGSLAELVKSEPGDIEPHLARHADFRTRPFAALNTSFFADGAFVRIGKGIAAAEPIHLVFVSAGLDGEPIRAHPRALIRAASHSRATVIVSYVGIGAGIVFTNPVTEAVLDDGAVVELCVLQRERESDFHVGATQAVIGAGASFTSHVATLSGAFIRNDLDAALTGEGASCALNGLFMTSGRQHVDNHTTIDHVMPHTTSLEMYKGVLDGQSTGVFNGRITVRKDAQKIDARQSNKNLLLSAEAVINTNPQLEINADDVKCTHGATIGRLDEQALFYLLARGIGLEDARAMLIHAFASQVIDPIRCAPVRTHLADLLRTRLPGELAGDGLLS